MPVLDACLTTVSELKAVDWVIINFRGVPSTVDRNIFPLLANLQKAIRSKPARLRLNAIHPDLRKLLLEQGLIWKEEITNCLTEALQQVMSKAPAELKKAA